MRVAIFFYTGVKRMDTVQVEILLLNYENSHISLGCKQLELTIYGVSSSFSFFPFILGGGGVGYMHISPI